MFSLKGSMKKKTQTWYFEMKGKTKTIKNKTKKK